jgi:hypothetical protein
MDRRGRKLVGSNHHPAARLFLWEFGGLEIAYPEPDGEGRVLDFSPAVIAKGFALMAREDLPTFRRFEQCVGPVVPVGEDEFTWLTLFLSPAGALYGAFCAQWPFDDRIVRLGASWYEAIENLIGHCGDVSRIREVRINEIRPGELVEALLPFTA